MMKWSLAALIIGFGIDLVVGDPHGFPHPVILIRFQRIQISLMALYGSIKRF